MRDFSSIGGHLGQTETKQGSLPLCGDVLFLVPRVQFLGHSFLLCAELQWDFAETVQAVPIGPCLDG